MSTYVLTWDPVNPALNWAQIDAFVTSNRYVASWFKPYAGTYIVKGNTDLLTLTGSFKSFFNGHPFFVAAIVPNFTGGAFSPEVWDWINHDQLPGQTTLASG